MQAATTIPSSSFIADRIALRMHRLLGKLLFKAPEQMQMDKARMTAHMAAQAEVMNTMQVAHLLITC